LYVLNTRFCLQNIVWDVCHCCQTDFKLEFVSSQSQARQWYRSL